MAVSSHCDYDFIAPYYDRLANLVFGRQLWLAKSFFLSQLNDPQDILILGGGSGRLLTPLLEFYPNVNIHFLEASSAMILLARSRLSPEVDNVWFQLGNEKDIVENKYDTVITPFVLDVFENSRLDTVIGLIFKSLKPGGSWIHTDFQVSKHAPYWQRGLIRIMYWFFRVTANQRNLQLPDFEYFFNRLHLRALDQKLFCNDMVKTTLYRKCYETEPSH